MPRFAANITTMFLELPMSERIQAALSCGFKAAEFLLPYEWPAEEIRSWPGADEIEFILMNTQPASDEAAGCAALLHVQCSSAPISLKYCFALDLRVTAFTYSRGVLT